MTLRNKVVASALSFAHLAGIGSNARVEDDAPEKKDDDKAKRAEGDDPKKGDEDDDKKVKKAESDDDKKDAEDDKPDNGDDEDEDDKKSKAKAKGAKADDEDDDEEMRGNSAASAARRRERARCASIFASKAAAKNPALAANLAFNTSMTRQEALVVLESSPPAIIPGADRAARNPQIAVDAGAKQSPQQATAARWDQNLKAANPSTRR